MIIRQKAANGYSAATSYKELTCNRVQL